MERWIGKWLAVLTRSEFSEGVAEISVEAQQWGQLRSNWGVWTRAAIPREIDRVSVDRWVLEARGSRDSLAITAEARARSRDAAQASKQRLFIHESSPLALSLSRNDPWQNANQ